MADLVYSSTYLLNGIHVVPSYETGSTSAIFIFGLDDGIEFASNAEYTLKLNTICVKSGSYDAQLDVYISGSSFPSTDENGVLIESFEVLGDQTLGRFENHEVNFTALADGDSQLRFVQYGGDWHISDVQILTARERGFNPDEATVYIPIFNRRFETLQFKSELYDGDNKKIAIDIESDPTFFDGGNTILRGDDNRIDGTVTITPSGSGPVLGVNSSGSYIGISDFSRVRLPQPVYITDIDTYTGPSHVTMYSGTTPFTQSAVGPAVGFQIAGVDQTTGVTSFLDFNTVTGRLTIMGEIQFLPDTLASESLFGSGSGSGLGALALERLERLVNGSSSEDYPDATFLRSDVIFSPAIAGRFGYISQSFGVGDVTNNRGIILTALGYESASVFYNNRPAIFIGGINDTGSFASSSTPFFAASGSGGAKFSLSDLVYFQSHPDNSACIIISASNLELNATPATSSLRLGEFINLSSGSGFYVDNTGELRLGQYQPAASGSDRSLRYSITDNVLRVRNAAIVSGTIESLKVNTLLSDSNITDLDAMSSLHLHASESLVIAGPPGVYASFGSSSINPLSPSFVMYSGSTGGTLLEIGTYTKIFTPGSGSTGGSVSFTNQSSGSMIGNDGIADEIMLTSDVQSINATGKIFQDNQIRATGRWRINEENDQLDPSYLVYGTSSLSCSWTQDWNDDVNSNVTELKIGTSEVTTDGDYIVVYSHIPISVPTRTGDTLYVRLQTKFTTNDG